MIIRQLSIFLENRTGRINEVARILGENGINMQAFSMAETADFGVVRRIVPDVEGAVEVLRSADIAGMVTDVLCVNCPNVPGSLSAILEKLAANNIFIEYMYAFSEDETANVVIRPNDIEKCIDVLGSCGCTLLQEI